MLVLVLIEPHVVPTASAKSRHPVNVIEVAIQRGQRYELLRQINDIADKQRLAIRTDRTEPSGNTLLIQLWRNDLNVVVSNASKPDQFGFALFSIGLTSESAEKDARNDFIEALKASVKCIPGATMTVTK
jgi:hypothetical protein